MNEGFTSRARRATIATTAAVMLVTVPHLSAQAPPPGSGPINFSGFVRVVDGDTFEMYIDGHRTGAGIVGIRAPMGNTSCGRLATAYLQSLLPTPGIRLEEDPIAPPFDARKRRLYRLILADGRSAAVAMAEAGYATPTGDGIEANDIAAAAGRAASVQAGCAAPESTGTEIR
jgi:endonuclease YncB( thermonuclease family)